MSAPASPDRLVAFFDALARTWDTRGDPAETRRRVDEAVAAWGVGPDERVLDVGCGTGDMTAALLRRLGPEGRIVAVDISPRMIEQARRKNPDPRVEWRCAPIETVPLEQNATDRVVCMGVWPHLADPPSMAHAFHCTLRPGGFLHVWHTIPRARVNAIHAASDAVAEHQLAPARDTAALLQRCGFAISACVDDEREYLVTGRKAAPCPP